MSAPNVSQKLSASAGYPEDYRLMELTPEILAQLEAAEKSTLVVRGREDDVAVLVDSEERTYQLHTAHTSNGLYLMTQSPEGLELRTKLNQTFELHKTQPQIRARVLEVLGWETRGPFSGAELEDQPSPPQSDSEDVAMAVDGDMSRRASAVRHVTDEVLARHVQAGDRQLRRVLAEVPAFRHAERGHWRVVDPAYCMELLRLILATQIERDWSLDALDAKEVYLALRSDAGGDALLPEAVEAVLGRFSNPALGCGSAVYAMDNRRVARFLAEQIFATEGSRAWPVSEFLAALQATMPPQLQLGDIADLENWRSKAIPQSL
ncbi:Ctf8p and Ctf18p associating protein, partial [Coemansia guatemalensis]